MHVCLDLRVVPGAPLDLRFVPQLSWMFLMCMSQSGRPAHTLLSSFREAINVSAAPFLVWIRALFGFGPGRERKNKPQLRA